MTDPAPLPLLRDPLQSIALGYAPVAVRAGLRAVWALDAALADVVRTTTQPMVGQLRLAWWRERLAALPDAPVAGEPVLRALWAVGEQLETAAFQRMVDGWEILLARDVLDEATIGDHACARGPALFALSAAVLGSSAPGTDCGAGWAAFDLSRHWRDATAAEAARAFAAAALASCKVPGTKPLRILVRAAELGVRQAAGARLRRRDIARAVIF